MIVGKALYEGRFDGRPTAQARLDWTLSGRDALQARDPVPRRRPRAGRQGRRVRRPARRRRPGRAGRRYDAAGADELVFLDITATSDKRETVVELARRAADERVHPVHDRRRDPLGRTTPRPCSTPAPTRSRSTRPRSQRPELIDELRGHVRRPVRGAGDRRQGAGADGRAGRRIVAGGRTPTGRDAVAWAREGVERGRGGDPADQHGPRRHQRRLRPRLTAAVAGAVGVPVIASGGAGSARAPVRRHRRRAPTPCCVPRSSTTGSTRWREVKEALARDGVSVRPVD